MFCKNCGAEANDKAVVCIKCGCALESKPASTVGNANTNEWLTAVLLCFFLGWLGIHRFYTKNMGIGLAQLLLGMFTCCVISLVWSFVDLILLLTGSYRTGDGRLLCSK